tara:strand:+ start:412 stop:1218 length:807 start_codon:yes stop_codon:yes gene_type:complete
MTVEGQELTIPSHDIMLAIKPQLETELKDIISDRIEEHQKNIESDTSDYISQWMDDNLSGEIRDHFDMDDYESDIEYIVERVVENSLPKEWDDIPTEVENLTEKVNTLQTQVDSLKSLVELALNPKLPKLISELNERAEHAEKKYFDLSELGLQYRYIERLARNGELTEPYGANKMWIIEVPPSGIPEFHLYPTRAEDTGEDAFYRQLESCLFSDNPHYYVEEHDSKFYNAFRVLNNMGCVPTPEELGIKAPEETADVNSEETANEQS